MQERAPDAANHASSSLVDASEKGVPTSKAGSDSFRLSPSLPKSSPAASIAAAAAAAATNTTRKDSATPLVHHAAGLASSPPVGLSPDSACSSAYRMPYLADTPMNGGSSGPADTGVFRKGGKSARVVLFGV